MTLGEKLVKLRKENNYTQEKLADILGVSRQAISKWESDVTYPETDKLLRLGELYQCSMDYLLKDKEEKVSLSENSFNLHSLYFERKSKKTICGLPLWHINIGLGRTAKGIVALGLAAKGVLSFGLLSLGVFSFGTLSFGAFALGALAMGLLTAGAISLGIIAFGAISIGVISIGALSIGCFSVGALSIGKYFALGANARAMIAVGDEEAVGSVFQKIGDMSETEISMVKDQLSAIVPSYLGWAKKFIQIFIK